MMLYTISLLDWIALALFIMLWAAYTWFADVSRWSANSLQKIMDFHRRRWMGELLRRPHVADALVTGNFIHSAVFFASTAVLVIGGLVTALGASDKALSVMSALPFVTPSTPGLWELKIVSLIGVFMYAFVKFVWAVRLANYNSVLFSAVSFHGEKGYNAYAETYADGLGKIASLCAQHFNQGLRANFFALAILGWWLNIWCFFISTGMVLWLLYRREFRSRSRRVADNLRQLVESADHTSSS